MSGYLAIFFCQFRMVEKVLEENGMISREAFEKFFQ
jgi:hypothetical protein